jgi:hypothetical protein
MFLFRQPLVLDGQLFVGMNNPDNLLKGAYEWAQRSMFSLEMLNWNYRLESSTSTEESKSAFGRQAPRRRGPRPSDHFSYVRDMGIG